MTMRKILLIFICAACVTPLLRLLEWSVSAGAIQNSIVPLQMQFIREYQHTVLRALSPDRRSMIVWETKSPIMLQRRGDSTLQWIEIASGKLLAKTTVEDNHFAAFLPGGDKVIYRTEPVMSLDKTTLEIWDLERNVTQQCLAGSEAHFLTQVAPISDTRFIGRRDYGGDKPENVLVVRSVPDCELFRDAALDPHRHRRGTPFPITVSPDKHWLAYPLLSQPPSTVFVFRRTEDLGIEHEVDVPMAFFPMFVRFTPDSKTLVAVLERLPSAKQPESLFKLTFYDVKSGNAIRDLNVNAQDALAISPDGRVIAAGWHQIRGRRSYLIISLHDLQTGEELARVEHSSAPRATFEGLGLSTLEFAANGEYLVSGSSESTRVWKITNQNRN